MELNEKVIEFLYDSTQKILELFSDGTNTNSSIEILNQAILIKTVIEKSDELLESLKPEIERNMGLGANALTKEIVIHSALRSKKLYQELINLFNEEKEFVSNFTRSLVMELWEQSPKYQGIEKYFNTSDSLFNTNAFYWRIALKENGLFEEIEDAYRIMYRYFDFLDAPDKPISCVDLIFNDFDELGLNDEQRVFILDKFLGMLYHSGNRNLDNIFIEILDRRHDIKPIDDDPEIRNNVWSIDYLRNEYEKLSTVAEKKRYLKHKKLEYLQTMERVGFDSGLGTEIDIELEYLDEIGDISPPDSTNTNTDKGIDTQAKMEEKFQASEALPKVVILTAILQEYRAVADFLADIEEINLNGTFYDSGIFEVNGKRVANVIIRECGPKNTLAAQETERAILRFNPKVIMFVGIAGSRKPKDFGLADVIFPTHIYSYEAGKAEQDSFAVRPDLIKASYELLEIAKKERRKSGWKSFIKDETIKNVKADLGIIASGEQIIEHYESDIGNILTNHYNDTSAVEMEGFGFASAASRQGRDSNDMMIGVVRGISDIIGQPNDDSNSTGIDKRPMNAKINASKTAAAFAYWLIMKVFDQSS